MRLAQGQSTGDKLPALAILTLIVANLGPRCRSTIAAKIDIKKVKNLDRFR